MMAFSLQFRLHFCRIKTELYCKIKRGRRDRMVVGFTTTCAISTYRHESCEFEPRF